MLCRQSEEHLLGETAVLKRKVDDGFASVLAKLARPDNATSEPSASPPAQPVLPFTPATFDLTKYVS